MFALNAHRNMKNVGLEQGRASNRLSSGFRINSAADDAAGLAISENMRSQIRGLDQASRNAQDGQSMLLTTEGGLEEIGNMLQRVRELLVQGANDTNTQNQRAMIDQEINQLSQEIASMQQRVEFNTNRVLAMGPAIDSEILDDIRLLTADNLVVSEAFAALNENRMQVAEAREALLALDPLMSVEDVQDITRLSSLLDRVFASRDFDAYGDDEIFSLDTDDSDVVLAAHELGEDLDSLEVSFTVRGSDFTMEFGDTFDWTANASDWTVTDLLTALAARDDLIDEAVIYFACLRLLTKAVNESKLDLQNGFNAFNAAHDNMKKIVPKWYRKR